MLLQWPFSIIIVLAVKRRLSMEIIHTNNLETEQSQLLLQQQQQQVREIIIGD